MNILITLLSLLGGAALFLFILWIFFLAVMNLMRVRDNNQLTPIALNLGNVVKYLGLLLDVLANLFIMPFIFLEVPKEWVVSMRVQRHYHGEGWRQKLAIWFADNLLNPFDPSGRHIK